MTPRRSAFTLIEILVACILLGVGVTSVIGVLLVSMQRTREITALSTVGPVASAAVQLCVVHDQVPAGSAHLDLPSEPMPFAFESPYALRIDRAPASEAPIAAADDARLVTLRVRAYEQPDHRELGVRPLATVYIRQYLRPKP